MDISPSKFLFYLSWQLSASSRYSSVPIGAHFQTMLQDDPTPALWHPYHKLAYMLANFLDTFQGVQIRSQDYSKRLQGEIPNLKKMKFFVSQHHFYQEWLIRAHLQQFKHVLPPFCERYSTSVKRKLLNDKELFSIGLLFVGNLNLMGFL